MMRRRRRGTRHARVPRHVKQPQDYQDKGTDMQMALTYTDGSTEEISVGPKATVQFEAAGKRMDRSGETLTWLYELAWFGTGRKMPWEEFLDRLESVDVLEEEEAEPGPTTSGQPD